MKKVFLGMLMLSFPLHATEKIGITSEVLLGKTQNKLSSSHHAFSSSLRSDSFGFRIGWNITDNVVLEIAKQDHGETVQDVTHRIPTVITGPTGLPITLAPEFDTIVESSIPIELESVRIGVKGQLEVFENLRVNARLGVARWDYGMFSPLNTAYGASSPNLVNNGNDLFYSMGADYKFSDNFYLGLEYSVLNIEASSDNNTLVSNSFEHDVKDLSLVLGWKF